MMHGLFLTLRISWRYTREWAQIVRRPVTRVERCQTVRDTPDLWTRSYGSHPALARERARDCRFMLYWGFV